MKIYYFRVFKFQNNGTESNKNHCSNDDDYYDDDSNILKNIVTGTTEPNSETQRKIPK